MTAVGADVLDSRVQVAFKDGKLRALAVTGKTRSQTLLDVETMAEAGYPDIEGDSWVGVLVPAGTPKDIITLLNREIVTIISHPDMRERLVTLGHDPVAGTPEDSRSGSRLKSAPGAR